MSGSRVRYDKEQADRADVVSEVAGDIGSIILKLRGLKKRGLGSRELSHALSKAQEAAHWVREDGIDHDD